MARLSRMRHWTAVLAIARSGGSIARACCAALAFRVTAVTGSQISWMIEASCSFAERLRTSPILEARIDRMVIHLAIFRIRSFFPGADKKPPAQLGGFARSNDKKRRSPPGLRRSVSGSTTVRGRIRLTSADTIFSESLKSPWGSASVSNRSDHI